MVIEEAALYPSCSYYQWPGYEAIEVEEEEEEEEKEEEGEEEEEEEEEKEKREEEEAGIYAIDQRRYMVTSYVRTFSFCGRFVRSCNPDDQVSLCLNVRSKAHSRRAICFWHSVHIFRKLHFNNCVCICGLENDSSC